MIQPGEDQVSRYWSAINSRNRVRGVSSEAWGPGDGGSCHSARRPPRAGPAVERQSHFSTAEIHSGKIGGHILPSSR